MHQGRLDARALGQDDTDEQGDLCFWLKQINHHDCGDLNVLVLVLQLHSSQNLQWNQKRMICFQSYRMAGSIFVKCIKDCK